MASEVSYAEICPVELLVTVQLLYRVCPYYHIVIVAAGPVQKCDFTVENAESSNKWLLISCTKIALKAAPQICVYPTGVNSFRCRHGCLQLRAWTPPLFNDSKTRCAGLSTARKAASQRRKHLGTFERAGFSNAADGIVQSDTSHRWCCDPRVCNIESCS